MSVSVRGWRQEGMAKCPGYGQGPKLDCRAISNSSSFLSSLNFLNLIFDLVIHGAAPPQTHIIPSWRGS
jgi:hypothetical protein